MKMSLVELKAMVDALEEELNNASVQRSVLSMKLEEKWLDGVSSKRLEAQVRHAEKTEEELQIKFDKACKMLESYSSEDAAAEAFNAFVAKEQAEMANCAPVEQPKLGTKKVDKRSEKLHLDMERMERLTINAAEKQQRKDEEALRVNERKEKTKMEGIKLMNDGNPVDINDPDGETFTVTPGTAKKRREYRTDKFVPLTEYEHEMPGVVVGQDRGMLFSSNRPIAGDLPSLDGINLIIVPEKSRKLKPIDDDENKVIWVGNGPHEVKDVCGDGQFHHWLDYRLWFKTARFLYGGKGMGQPGLATDVGCKVKDFWGVERTITAGNTILMNTSVIKGIAVYKSLEALIEHSKMWGLTTIRKQWQSGDHTPEKVRQMGTQPMSTNLKLTMSEIEELEKPEARKIFAMKYPKIAWMALANANTSRGRAFAAHPELLYKDLVMNQVDTIAGNTFRCIAQGKVKCEGQYLKMYQDKLVYSLVYVHGMDMNEAAKKAAETGLHGELRVNPFFAGRYYAKDEDGNTTVHYKKKTGLDSKGRYIEAALVRYPHGAPSETIVVKLYLDDTVPKDVIIFPLPVANDDGTICVKYLYAMRLQGADFDGDAVTAYTEEIWLKAQKRNAGESYMAIPVNTESTEKDMTRVTDETWEFFCHAKVDSLTNEVGLIATSLKYLLSQVAADLRNGNNGEKYMELIAKHACAMGDDIDEFKHGRANRTLELFAISRDDGSVEALYGPYFNRYAKKYRSEEDFNKAVYTKKGIEKHPGSGTLDMCAVAAEKLMGLCGIEVVKEVADASDGTKRYYYTVHPVKWEKKNVDLFVGMKGYGPKAVALPEELEAVYGLEHGTLLSQKDLFVMLYRDHAATCKMLMNGCNADEDRDEAIKAIAKIDERFALAKVAIVAWTKRMVLEKENREIDASEAMKIFTTLMVQHNGKSRSILDVLTQTGTFTRQDGSVYEKTMFNAQRPWNYFLDVCGDGLFLLGQNEPKFPAVSDAIVKSSGMTEPDMEKARDKVAEEMIVLGKLVDKLSYGVEEVLNELSEEEAERINNEMPEPEYNFWANEFCC